MTESSYNETSHSKLNPATVIQDTNGEREYYITVYYMALSHKGWELPNSRIWLAEMDIDRGLDFPI